MAPISFIAAARAKRVARAIAGQGPRIGGLRFEYPRRTECSGLMTGRVLAGRVQLVFSQPVESFYLSPAQARFWASALLTLADSVDGGESGAE